MPIISLKQKEKQIKHIKMSVYTNNFISQILYDMLAN